MLKKSVSLILVLIALSLVTSCNPLVLGTSSSRKVTDISGRTVKLPDKVSKAACLHGPTYEMVFSMGGKDQIGFVRPDHKTAYPLAKLTNSDLQKYSTQITQVGPKASINIEEFINAAPDLVLYYNLPEPLAQLDAAGIPAVTVAFGVIPKDINAAVEDQKNRTRIIAEALGGDAPKRYEKWAKYYEEKVTFLRSRTENLPPEKRPKVYIGNSFGPNPLSTWGKDSTANFGLTLAGAVFVPRELDMMQFPEVNMEQVIKWAPDVVFIDNHGREPEKVIADIKKDPGWAVLPALKNGKVYRMPSGVFFLDKGTSAPVYFLWAAKTLHPELFGDVDLGKEAQYFFKEFYGYDLTKEQAEKVLAGWND